MDFEIDKGEDFTTIKVLAERLDARTAPLLKSEVVIVSGTGQKNIILDISKCSFCDSAGLNAIITSNRLCKNSDGILVVAGLQEQVEHVMSVSQLDRVLNIAYRVISAEHKMFSLIEKG